MYLVAYTASLHIPLLIASTVSGEVIKTIWDLPEHHIHYVLRQIWLLKPGPNDTDHKPQSTMYGFVVPSSYIRLLAVYITLMLLCTLGIFWNEFLLEKNIQYFNPSKVDCFFIKSYWDRFKLVEPIDCNNHVASRVSGNPTFECYKYKFDLTGASLAAAPVLAFSAAIIKVLPICFLFLKQCDTQRYRRLQHRIAFLCFFIASALLMLAGKNLQEFTTALKLCSISYGILLSLTVSILDFRLIPAARDQ